MPPDPPKPRTASGWKSGNNGVGGVAYRRPVADIAYPIAERTLANGLRVIVSEDHTVPNVAVNLWVGVGSRHEPAGDARASPTSSST